MGDQGEDANGNLDEQSTRNSATLVLHCHPPFTSF